MEFKVVSEIDLENATRGSDVGGEGPEQDVFPLDEDTDAAISDDIRGDGDRSSDLLLGMRGGIGGLFLLLTTPCIADSIISAELFSPSKSESSSEALYGEELALFLGLTFLRAK